MTLTDKQSQVLDFIKGYSAEQGFPPTIREIADKFGIKSPNGVVCHLKALEKKGLIKRLVGLSRAICVVQ